MLTFAGEELLFPTAELDAWMARNQELCDLSQFGHEQSRIYSGRHACRSRFEQNKGLGLPVVNWPAPPAPRLNTLYWPTGATRWAMGWFICSDITLTKILAKTVPSNYSRKSTLGIGDDIGGNPLGLDMYMLTPRLMSITAEADVGDVYLIPLVDERYFWQFANAGNLEVTTSTTWASLISSLGTQIGVTIDANPTVPSTYLKPDPIDFTRRYDNAALLLDAAAWSIGRRIVRRLDGSVICQNEPLSKATRIANLNQGLTQLAGNQLISRGSDLPGGVTVTFRKIKQYLLRSNGQLYTVDKTPPDGTITVQGRKLTIHSAAYADYSTADALQNGTALGSLAGQISDDFYAWSKVDYDITFAGIAAWMPCGYDDSILWAFGRLPPEPCYGLVRDEEGKAVDLEQRTEYLAYTRVQTLPSNTWPELNLCSDSTKEIVEPRQLGKPVNDIASGASDDVKLWSGPAGSETEISPAKTIKAFNRGSATLSEDKFCWLEGINDAVWYAGCME